MKGLRSLVATTLALLLVFSFIGNSSSAPQGLFERRNWTPQSMLYLKGAQGRRFISDQSRKKDLSDRPPPERRSPNPQLLTLPETAALLLASLQRPQEESVRSPLDSQQNDDMVKEDESDHGTEAGEENFDQTGILEDY